MEHPLLSSLIMTFAILQLMFGSTFCTLLVFVFVFVLELVLVVWHSSHPPPSLVIVLVSMSLEMTRFRFSGHIFLFFFDARSLYCCKAKAADLMRLDFLWIVISTTMTTIITNATAKRHTIVSVSLRVIVEDSDSFLLCLGIVTLVLIILLF